MSATTLRYCPERPLPPYTYVPGASPHPISDPRGHSFGHEPPPPEPLSQDNYRTNAAYLYALDLFNHGYYWEAHEAWEALWHAARRSGPTADFLKGLIKLAAAGVKRKEGRAAGVGRHARRAAELLNAAKACFAEAAPFGLVLDELAAAAAAIALAEPAVPPDVPPAAGQLCGVQLILA